MTRAPTKVPGLWRRVGRGDVPAGVLDSATTSLGTFLVGLAAVRYLDLDTLGTYALGFMAYLLASTVPAVLVFTPAEVLAVASAKGGARVGVLSSSVRRGVLVAVPASVLVSLAVVLVPSTTPLQDRVWLALTLVPFAAVAPVQDHLRRVLHAAGRSWDAVAASALRLVAVVAVLAGVLLSGDVGSPLVPFGTLAVATVLSAVCAWIRARPAAVEPLLLTWRRAVSQGGVLVLGSIAQFASAFAVVALVTAVSGADAIAQYEAARLASQPVAVVIVGLLSVLGPLTMTSVAEGDRAAAVRRIRYQLLLATAVTAGWIVVAHLPVDWNPVRLAVPRAYDVALLLPFVVVLQAIAYVTPAYRVVPLVHRVSRPLFLLDLAGGGLAVVTAVLLAREGAWAVAVAGGLGSGVVLVGCGLLAASLLRRGRPAPPRETPGN